LQQEHAKTSIELLQKLTKKLAAEIMSISEENSSKTIEILKLQSRIGEIEHQGLANRMNKIELAQELRNSNKSQRLILDTE